jgi:hypothetical protein
MARNDRVLQPSTFVELKRTWKTGDTIELTLPKSVRLEPTPDDRSVAAIMWGPLVLAGDLGPRREGRIRTDDESATVPTAPAAIPLLVAAGRPVTEWVVPSGERVGDFRARQVAQFPATPGTPSDVSLTPFYRTHRRTYSVYLDVVTPAQFDARVAAITAERERVRRLEEATIGVVQMGDATAERAANYQSEPADRPTARTIGRLSRAGAGWFALDLPVDGAADTAIVVTYLNEQGLAPARGNFDVLVDGTSVGHFAPNDSATGFFDVKYSVPAQLTRGKSKVTVKFQASTNGRIAPIFAVRSVRADKM